jgi:hypothetical protein
LCCIIHITEDSCEDSPQRNASDSFLHLFPGISIWTRDLNTYCSASDCYIKLMLFLIISSRDAKLVYGCDVEERKRCARKTRKRCISGRDLTTLSVASNDTDPHVAKINLRKTRVCCLLWLLFFVIILWFLVA